MNLLAIKRKGKGGTEVKGREGGRYFISVFQLRL